MTPGDAIKRAMIKLRLNQRQLAVMVDVSEGYMSELRRGKKIPGKEVALKLSELSGYPVERFITETDDPGEEAEVI